MDTYTTLFNPTNFAKIGIKMQHTARFTPAPINVEYMLYFVLYYAPKNAPKKAEKQPDTAPIIKIGENTQAS